MPVKAPVSVLKLELANSIIHGLGVLFSIMAMPVLLIIASHKNDYSVLAGTAMYGFSFLMVFTFSTLYHGFQQPLAKEVMKILDHISIYFLIAGTYTPLILTYFNNTQGNTMLVLLWSLAIAGIFFKIFFVNRFRGLSVAIYVMMGWMLIWTGNAFFAAMPLLVITLILVGNFLYSAGLVFYLWRRWVYHHAYWHSLVLMAAICHYTAILVALK
jgi:hemolysin III